MLVTCRPEDRCIGAAHWVQFPIDCGQPGIAHRLPPAGLFRHADVPDYRHESGFLSEEMRQSLFEDLQMSDKD